MPITVTFLDAAIGVLVAVSMAVIVGRSLRRESEAHRAWVAAARTVEGIVERIRVTQDADSWTQYTPVIVYRVDGHAYSIDGATSGERDVEPGTKMSVAYDPKLPSSARLADGRKPPSEWDRKADIIVFVVGATIVTFAVAAIRALAAR
jgi:hypothetical protein